MKEEEAVMHCAGDDFHTGCEQQEWMSGWLSSSDELLKLMRKFKLYRPVTCFPCLPYRRFIKMTVRVYRKHEISKLPYVFQ